MISVVVPVYNVEKYIVTCLNSIVAQDYRDFELIVVNDGSKDKSIDFVQDFLQDKDVTWKIVNKENGGLASARNAGILKAKGEYVVCIDADDAVHENFLSSLLREMREDTDFVFCNFRFVKKQEVPDDTNDQITVFDKESLLEVFLKRNIGFVVPSMLFKKNFLLEKGLLFDEKIRFSEDQPFIWNVILHSQKSVYLHQKLYGYYVRDNSIMTSSSGERIIESHKEFKKTVSSYFSDFPQYKSIEKRLFPRWELGALYSAARIMDYEEFKIVYTELDGRTIFQRISGINEIKACLLAFVCSSSPKLLYVLCRRMDLNG